MSMQIEKPRRAGTLFTGSTLFLCLIAAATGCGATPQGGSADCEQYINCVAAVSQSTLNDSLAAFGKDGSCWKSLDSEACSRSCRSGLDGLLKVFPTQTECGGKPAPMPMDPPPRMDPDPFWDYPQKTMYYTGMSEPAQLTGIDPVTGLWRCTRDDKNPNPSDSVLHQGEPNDQADMSIVLPNPLPIDPPPTFMGSAYQICPDRSAPTVPDVDVYKFKLLTTSPVVVQARYQVKAGDLDIGIFRIDLDPVTGKSISKLIKADLSNVDNACIETAALGPGTYYVVVWGSPISGMPHKYAMNDYRLRVFTTEYPGTNCP